MEGGGDTLTLYCVYIHLFFFYAFMDSFFFLVFFVFFFGWNYHPKKLLTQNVKETKSINFTFEGK